MPDNLTETEYLTYVLGPQYLPLDVVIPLTLIYVTIFVCGMFGNIVTCLVIIKNVYLQNSTNFYLFSLAVSDLLLLILGLPNELSVFWQQYPWILGNGLCKLRAYISEMSSYVSVLTIMMFSFERYLAVHYPFQFNSVSGLQRSICIIISIWIVASLCAVPFAQYTTVSYVEYPIGSGNFSLNSAICAMLTVNMPNYPLYECSSMIFFFIPMFAIFTVYLKMNIKIRRSFKLASKLYCKSLPKNSIHAKSQKGVTTMLNAVVLTFLLCWAPFHTQRLLYIYGQDADYYPDMNEWLYIISGCFYYLSTAINPLIYNFVSSRYRIAYKQLLKWHKNC